MRSEERRRGKRWRVKEGVVREERNKMRRKE